MASKIVPAFARGQGKPDARRVDHRFQQRGRLMLRYVKTAAKEALAPVLYKHPPSGLAPERLAIYLTALLERRELPGDVAEVGCNIGGTAAIAARMLRRVENRSRYICYDTFGGFVPEQFSADARTGTTENSRTMFSANSTRLVRKILDLHDCEHVELVAGDIATVAEGLLSPVYSVVLVDVDLSEPTYVALKRFWPRLAPGGAIFVDDCQEDGEWKAQVGYRRFCSEYSLPEEYHFGLGVLHRSL
ncbi:MAG: class I SAM-dependent methyltransferase [Alphaproteobacteria bacterium]|nr:class I SAM-dependent methyltransferase [Alphaproteobacteria bacterium]MDE2012316.1 class I SAM-dependent methyltransferase [Alphaproteobacteria bacterium]MDE2072989.1 class I SAM-dependent methyltransferase [Alphaproteobacteria bacterium]MDE2352078.1 class I SAM-dependent methyltransferase [Alphaproteobacteria bacterium]